MTDASNLALRVDPQLHRDSRQLTELGRPWRYRHLVGDSGCGAVEVGMSDEAPARAPVEELLSALKGLLDAANEVEQPERLHRRSGLLRHSVDGSSRLPVPMLVSRYERDF